MPSFDVVSEADQHEIQNALDQTTREIGQRFDFRGTDTEVERTKEGFQITSGSEEKVKAAYEVLVDKFVRRKISLKFLDKEDPQPAGGQTFKMPVKLKQGIDKDNARKIVQMIKNDKKLKVTPSIQGESVRVTGKKRDDLQTTMTLLKEQDLPVELSFTNFRD